MKLGPGQRLAVAAAGVAMLAAASLLVPARAVAPAAPGAQTSKTASPPRRIVSLNLCTDQLLVDLVPRERIAGLSALVADPALSGRVDAARGMPLVRGHAEEVLALAPDLVLAGAYSTPSTVALLRRLGIAVVTVPMAADLEGVRQAVRAVAAAVGEGPRGEEVVARFDGQLAAVARRVPPVGAAAPGAIVYHVNGLVSTPGSLLDDVVRAAGFRNAAGTHHGPAGRMPIEALVTAAPDLLVLATAPATYRTAAADNLRHPVLAHVARKGRAPLDLPMPLWMCGTPDVAAAIELLAAARGQTLALDQR